MDMDIYMSNASQQAVMDSTGSFAKIIATYIVDGIESIDAEDGEIDALQAVRDHVPATRQNLPLKTIEIDTREAEHTYRVNVTWEKESSGSSSGSSDTDDDEPTVSFNCCGGTRHVENSLNQRHLKGDLDAGGMINWNGKTGSEMDVRGTDVPTGQIQKTYTRKMRLSDFTSAYERKLGQMAGTVNRSAWKGWEAGEVMFLGCSYNGVDRNSAKISVNYNFAMQPNESNVEVGGVSVDKKGFELLWAIKKTLKDSAGRPKVEVTDLYLDQVVNYSDFSELGI